MKPLLHCCRVFLLGSLGLLSLSCQKEVADPVCQYTESEKTGVQVNGATPSTYYYLMDLNGQQLAYAHLNDALLQEAGNYQLKVNNSLHPVTLKEGMLCKCTTASVSTHSEAYLTDYFYLLDTLGNQLAYAHLNEVLVLFPGRYTLKINNSQTAVSLELKQAMVINTAMLQIEGTTDAYYYVLDAAGQQLHYNKLQNTTPLLAGSYRVKLNNTVVPVTLESGNLTTLTSGTLLVRGTTDEYYYVFDNSGTQLHYQKLNQPSSFFSGHYMAKVNNSILETELSERLEQTLETGTVVATGLATGGYFYVLDKNNQQLAYGKSNQPLSFFAGEYSVRVNDITHKVTLENGKQQTVKF